MRLVSTFFVFELNVLVSWVVRRLQVARLWKILVTCARWIVACILQRRLRCSSILLVYWSFRNLPHFVLVSLIDWWISLLENHVVSLVAVVSCWHSCWHRREHVRLYCCEIIGISHAHVQLKMFDCWAYLQSLVDSPAVVCTASCGHCLVLWALSGSLVHVIVLWRIISPWVRPLLSLASVLQSSNDLHRIVMVLGCLVYFAVGVP